MEAGQRSYPGFNLPKPKIKRGEALEFRHNRVPSAPGGDDQVVEKEVQSILCVNCLDSVCEEAIDMHLEVCKAYVSLVSDDGVYAVNNSLIKYKAYMQHLHRTSGDPISNYLEAQTDRLMTATLQSSIQEVCEETHRILEDFSGTIHTKMCIDRLIAFANKKSQLIGVSQQRSERLKHIKKGIQKVSHKEAPKKRFTDGISIRKNVIADIQSELNTHIESERFSISQSGSTKDNTLNNLSGSLNGDGNKHEFYTRCLMAKHNYPPKHPVQCTPIQLLYQRATEQNITPENWDLFISQQLIAIDCQAKKPNKLNSQQVLSTRIDSIEEEDNSY